MGLIYLNKNEDNIQWKFILHKAINACNNHTKGTQNDQL